MICLAFSTISAITSKVVAQSCRFGVLNKDNSEILIFLFLNKNICCDLLLDGVDDESQHMFLWSNMENYPLIIRVTPFLSRVLMALNGSILKVYCRKYL